MPPRLHGSTGTTTSVAPAQRRRTTEQRRIGGTAISVRNWTDQVGASVRLHRSDGSARHLLSGRKFRTSGAVEHGHPSEAPRTQGTSLRDGQRSRRVRENAGSMALQNEAGRCSVRVVRDRGGPSGSPSAGSKLFMVDAPTTPNAEYVRDANS